MALYLENPRFRGEKGLSCLQLYIGGIRGRQQPSVLTQGLSAASLGQHRHLLWVHLAVNLGSRGIVMKLSLAKNSADTGYGKGRQERLSGSSLPM